VQQVIQSSRRPSLEKDGCIAIQMTRSWSTDRGVSRRVWRRGVYRRTT